MFILWSERSAKEVCRVEDPYAIEPSNGTDASTISGRREQQLDMIPAQESKFKSPFQGRRRKKSEKRCRLHW